jgi:transposase
MNKKKTCIVGIDVSKKTFNAHFGNKDGKYANNAKGWKRLASEIPEGSLCAMESTGYYYYRLASYLHSKGFGVKVFNPLWVRRYMQSLGSKAKTDKKDARLIAQYADTREVRERVDWEPLPPKLARMKMIVSLLARLTKMSTAAGNMNEAIGLVFSKQDSLLVSMDNVSFVCHEQIEVLEKELFGLVSEIYPEQFRLLNTIPSIGKKIAAVICVATKGMENFKSYKQLASWVGLAPSVFESGTSVKGRAHIKKTGNSYLRALLYMGTLSAVRFCKPCGNLYDRLVARGKSKMVSRVAVMHRIVKIAFGVIQSGEPYRGGRIAYSAAPT